MENMVYISEEMSEELPVAEALPPPSYSSIHSPTGLHLLNTLSRVDIQTNYVVTEQGKVIFGFKREHVHNTLYYELYDKRDRQIIIVKIPSSNLLEVSTNSQHGVHKTTLKRKKKIFGSSPIYVVSDADGSKAFRIWTPSNSKNYFLLRLIDLQGNEIGAVTRKWKGHMEDAFSDSNELQVDFPGNFKVQYKATVIAFCVHIVKEPMLIRTVLYDD